MVGIEQPAVPRERVLGAVSETMRRWPEAKGQQYGVVGDLPKGHDDRTLRQPGELPDQVAIAPPHFVRIRPVAGRQALNRIADAAIPEAQSVMSRYRLRSRRESRGVQRAVQENPRVIAGEGPPRAIGAVPARCEADDEQPVAAAAEGRDRSAMVVRVLDPDDVEMARQAPAQAAVRLERAPRPPQRALNCASSVEPRIAVIDELPPVTVCVTSSK